MCTLFRAEIDNVKLQWYVHNAQLDPQSSRSYQLSKSQDTWTFFFFVLEEAMMPSGWRVKTATRKKEVQIWLKPFRVVSLLNTPIKHSQIWRKKDVTLGLGSLSSPPLAAMMSRKLFHSTWKNYRDTFVGLKVRISLIRTFYSISMDLWSRLFLGSSKI